MCVCVCVCVCHGVVQSGGGEPFLGNGVSGRMANAPHYCNDKLHTDVSALTGHYRAICSKLRNKIAMQT